MSMTIMTVSRSGFVRILNVIDKSCRENQTHVLCSVNFFPPKIISFMGKCGKILYSRTGNRWKSCACLFHATNTLKICNAYCFSTATRVAQTRLNVTLYVLYIFCLLQHYLVKGTVAGGGGKLLNKNTCFYFLYNLRLRHSSSRE